MKKTTLLCSTLLAGLMPATAIHAQDCCSSFWTSDGTIAYDPGKGELRIPAVTIRANGFEPARLVFNVVLTHIGDETFRVVSSRGVHPREECTRAEVVAAIPQLRLDMSVAEASALIGCTAAISVRGHDLVLGRRVEASWRGQDGAPNPGSTGSEVADYNFSAVPSTWITGTTLPGVSDTSISRGGPSIVFSLREGVLESYSYQYEGATPLCDPDALAAGFPELEEGDNIAQIQAKLECDGIVGQTTVSAGQISEQVMWRSLTPSMPPSLSRAFDQQGIEVVLVNDVMVHATKTSSDVHYSSPSCSIDEIVAMSQAIQVGMSESAMLALSTCAANTVNSIETTTSRSAEYRWSTLDKAESVYVSVNRQLTVLVRDGEVSMASLRRQ